MPFGLGVCKIYRRGTLRSYCTGRLAASNRVGQSGSLNAPNSGTTPPLDGSGSPPPLRSVTPAPSALCRASSKTSIMPSAATRRSDTRALSSSKRNTPGRWPIDPHHTCPPQGVRSTRNEQIFSALPSIADIAQRLGTVARSADKLRHRHHPLRSRRQWPRAS
jgi:hypothetical protein